MFNSECSCHGKGTLEIKCSYCHRGEDIVCAASNDKKFCLKKHVDGTLRLDPDHATTIKFKRSCLCVMLVTATFL